MANWKPDMNSARSTQIAQKSIDDSKISGPVGIKPVQMKSTSDPIGKRLTKTPMPKTNQPSVVKSDRKRGAGRKK